MNEKGQALVETVVFFLSLCTLLVLLLGFTKWFTIRQRMILACREGALLYSSGRLTSEEVQGQLRSFLTHGSPALDAAGLELKVGRCGDIQARLLELDEIAVKYTTGSRWIQVLGLDPVLEEKCVIKHASHYGPALQHLLGPAIPW